MLRKAPKYIKATKADIEKKVAASKNQTVYFIDDMDDAIVGMYVRRFRKSKKRPKPCNVLVAVYDADLCIQCLAKMFAKDCDPADDPEEMAQEWFDYNTLGSLPNLYERMPVILMHDGEDTLQLINSLV